MDRFSITSSAAIAALGALLVIGAGPALANPGPGPKPQSGVSAPTGEPTSARVVPFRFVDCLAIIADASKEDGVKPVTLVNTADLRVARIEATDGSVTISCDRAAGRMALTKSPAQVASTVMAAR